MSIKALQLTWHSVLQLGSGSILPSTLGASAAVSGLCHAAERPVRCQAEMQRPELYEWWIDSILECLCQIAGQFDSLNPRGGRCSHVCDETYEDLEHFVEVVQSNGYCNVPAQAWAAILDLTRSDDLESDSAKLKATQCLTSKYFQDRVRWHYDRS